MLGSYIKESENIMVKKKTKTKISKFKIILCIIIGCVVASAVIFVIVLAKHHEAEEAYQKQADQFNEMRWTAVDVINQLNNLVPQSPWKDESSC